MDNQQSFTGTCDLSAPWHVLVRATENIRTVRKGKYPSSLYVSTVISVRVGRPGFDSQWGQECSAYCL